jgi:gliding motility-associated transport system ATP-binding protein
MIQVTNLTKWYGLRKAIDGLNFHAKNGEIVGFLGPNGAGKTTTMRILTAFMPPSEGRAIVAGYDVVEESLEVRKRVGYLPESVPMYPDMTVLDYLDFMAALRHLPNADQAVDEAIQHMHLEDRVESYIGNLSKGLKQRVGLAQAVLHKPEVMILDEPTGGLDPAQVVEVRNLIRELGSDHTVLLSTHILSEAQQLCNRVLIINKGHIVAEDRPENLQARLAGAERITIQLGGESDGADAVIAAVKGVLTVEPVGNNTFEVEVTPGKEIRPAIVRALTRAGQDVVEVHSQGVDLEQIFLELTRSDDKARGKSQSRKRKE